MARKPPTANQLAHRERFKAMMQAKSLAAQQRKIEQQRRAELTPAEPLAELPVASINSLMTDPVKLLFKPLLLWVTQELPPGGNQNRAIAALEETLNQCQAAWRFRNRTGWQPPKGVNEPTTDDDDEDDEEDDDDD